MAGCHHVVRMQATIASPSQQLGIEIIVMSCNDQWRSFYRQISGTLQMSSSFRGKAAGTGRSMVAEIAKFLNFEIWFH